MGASATPPTNLRCDHLPLSAPSFAYGGLILPLTCPAHIQRSMYSSCWCDTESGDSRESEASSNLLERGIAKLSDRDCPGRGTVARCATGVSRMTHPV